MKNRLFLRIMSFALVTGLTFSNAQITAFALEAENSIEEVVLTEEGEYETTSQIETVSETETNSETEIQESSVLEGSTETENCTDTEGVIEESEIQETNNEGTETIVDEGETIEDSTIIETETITEDINEALETDIEIMTETEASTEEDAKEYAQTAEADEIEAQSLEATAASTPESDFTWDGTTIVKYNGSAKEVIIPEKAQKIKGWAFSSNSNIESVTISKNITTIENDAFYKARKRGAFPKRNYGVKGDGKGF